MKCTKYIYLYKDKVNIIFVFFYLSGNFEALEDLKQQLNKEKKLLIVSERLATKNYGTNSRYSCKQKFCIFCKTLKTNLARHFEICHSEEAEVRKFLSFNKGSPERCEIIANLRKSGNYNYNKSNKENPILIRRVQKGSLDSLPCPNCKGFYSQITLSRHYAYCCKDLKDKNASRSVLRAARAMVSKIHPAACLQLKEKILPPMKQNIILDTVKKDMLLILIGNYLVPKYREHQEYMIRNKLRFLATYFLTVKKIDNSIDEFHKLFYPQHFDLALEAVKQMGEIDNNSSVYSKSTSALTITHYLKICCNILQSHYIRGGDDGNEKAVKRFFKLLKTEVPGKINKPAHRDLKRAGEAQRILVEDFRNIQTLRDTVLPELLNNLGDNRIKKLIAHTN
ncbi:uncharacterized protein LOC135143922 [Zophobas morio]|uniref:uncharacterized protein LOC135143922 n=1 Tax=Zophobas morio TaxID=2755281 RepID=UPI003082DC71